MIESLVRRLFGGKSTTKPDEKDQISSLREIASRATAPPEVDAAALKEEIAQIKAKIGTLRPIRSEGKDALCDKLNILESELRALERNLDLNYRRLDMQFMKECQRQQVLRITTEYKDCALVPAFALFDIRREPLCSLRFERTNFKLHKEIEQERISCSNELMERLADLSDLVELAAGTYKSGFTIWTSLSGDFPDELDDLIWRAERSFDQVLVCARVERWQHQIPPGYSLLIGRLAVGDLCWLIGEFDMSAVEKYVKYVRPESRA
jgi:hypothetical protein